MLKKIKVQSPIVEIDGDEMARILWHSIKKNLILPNIEIDIKYFDLSIQNRKVTNNKITEEAISAIKKYRVAAKCATITPNLQRQIEFQLPTLYESPNASIRNALQGTIFRKPIIFHNIPSLIKNWKNEIVIARHGFGDQYIAKDALIEKNSTISIVCELNNKNRTIIKKQMTDDSIIMFMYNNIQSIRDFANSCFDYALQNNYNVFLSTKNTVLKIYDGMFEEIFNEIFEQQFKELFNKKNLSYEHRLIDDMMSYAMRSKGGFLWACKNYDGDVQSDFVAQGFSGLGTMQSILIGKNNSHIVTEAVHGTVTRHFHAYLKGEETSTNPIGLISAWSQALKYRGIFDNNQELIDFAQKIDAACISVVEQGFFTKDIATIIESKDFISSNEFIERIKNTLQ